MNLNCLFRLPNSLVTLVTIVTVCQISETVTSQEAPSHGSFRFVNASASTSRLLLTIDGAKLRPEGFGSGEKTGMIGILSGPHRLDASSATAKPGQANIVVQPNGSVTIIAYTKTVPDPQGGKPSEVIQILSRPNPPGKAGKQFQVIYASNRPAVEVILNDRSTTLAAFREVQTDGIKVEQAGKPVIQFSAHENGNFLAVLFDKPDGALGGVVLPDYR